MEGGEGVFEQRESVNIRSAARPAIFCDGLIWFCMALFFIFSILSVADSAKLPLI